MTTIKILISERLAAMCLISFCLFSCNKEEKNPDQSQPIRIGVFSDSHIMDPSILISEGQAYNKASEFGNTLIKESPAILSEFVNNISSEKLDIVLVSGDLTKDGEEVSHKLIANNYLSSIRKQGIRVYVVPGNHDINNPNASTYDGDTKKRTKTISRDEFANIYGEYGYNDAIARDKYSLSYVVQPTNTLRIICIDSCKDDENSYENDFSVVAGAIRPSTMDFIREQAKEAKSKGIRMIAIMHHGIAKHWQMQSTIFQEYLINNYEEHAKEFMDLGIQVVFTGHSHSQDIVKYEANNKFLFDIETSSLTSYPCAYRIVSLKGDQMNITSKTIKKINYDTHGEEFPLYAINYFRSKLRGSLTTNSFVKFPDELWDIATPTIGNAMIANQEGDEKITTEEINNIKATSNSLNKISAIYGSVFTNIMIGLWTDLKPADNNITIDLSSGVVTE